MKISGRMRGFIHFRILETSLFTPFSEKAERRFFSKTISDFRILSGVRAQLNLTKLDVWIFNFVFLFCNNTFLCL